MTAPYFGLQSAVLSSIALMCLSRFADGISCYVCPHHDGTHICDPLELWGNRTQCPEGVTTCYKSWSVVADPVTVRKCGSRKDEPDEEGKGCTEKLQGNDKILLCKCGEDDCNGADGHAKKSNCVLATALVFATVLGRQSWWRWSEGL